jgi:hypothetical protein
MRLIASNKINLLCLGVASLFITTVTPAEAHPAKTLDFKLKVLWSTPITTPVPHVGETSCVGQSTGIVLTDQVLLKNNQILFLGEKLAPCKATQVFFTDLALQGFKNEYALNLQGVEEPDRGLMARFFGLNKPDKKPSILSLGVTSDGTVWAGGFNNSYTDIGSAGHSDIYLAKYGTVGKPVWEKLYGTGAIWKLAPTASEDIVVIGFKQGRSWFARISPDGRVVWETHIDKYNPISVTETADKKFVVIGYIMKSDAINSPSTSESALILDGNGKELSRTAISTQPYALASDTSVISVKDAIYVASSWADFRRVNPVEITKLNSSGKLLWRKPLSDTISLNSTHNEWRSCRPTMIVSSSGQPIVACALNGLIQLYNINGLTGSYHENYINLPECQKNQDTKIFIKASDDASMTISGTGGSCTWVGQLQRAND